jgi:hypothetical protein
MKSNTKHARLWAIIIATSILLSLSGTSLAVDDGARAYWKGREGTNVISFQYLRWDINASGSQQFDPNHYIYPNSDIEASVFIASWIRHMTLFNRPATLNASIVGGNVDVEVDTSLSPPEFLPPGVMPGSSFSQSASGYADPVVQLDVNLFGTSPLKSNVDLLNYEPKWTVDAAVMLGVPIGEYDKGKVVNLGLNRFYGRIALPIKYHFGVFSPGYMSSLELIPSVWIFTGNDDFVGQDLDNDPLFQFEAHLTKDFTSSFFGSIDLLYRSGFQSEINGLEVGEDLDIGDFGFTLNYQVNDNFTMRTSYMSNLFGDEDLDNSILRLQFVYGWNKPTENSKKLKGGH